MVGCSGVSLIASHELCTLTYLTSYSLTNDVSDSLALHALHVDMAAAEDLSAYRLARARP